MTAGVKVGDSVIAMVVPKSTHGAYREQIVLDQRAVVKAPKNTSYAEACTLPMNSLTARLSLDLLGLKPGNVLAVTGGPGAYGGYLIQLAKAESLTVIADSSKDDEELYNYIEDLWEPFLEWINLEFNCNLIVNYELFPVEQNKNEISKCISLVKHFDHFKFSGFSHIVNLTSSFILGLAFLYRKINMHGLYEIALAEELFQIKKWGSDEISEARRKNIKKEISEACEFLNCLQKK